MVQTACARTGSPYPEQRFDPRGEQQIDIGAFFDVSVDLLIIRDLNGIVIKASRSWQVSMGYSPDEMEGQSLMRLVHPDDMVESCESVVEVEQRKAGDPVVGFVNRYRHKNGHYRLVEWRAQRFGDRVYGVARDVTERVAAERAIIEAKATAEAANRAKSDFLANMSHEIRTPLNGVIGIVDALARTGLTSDQMEMVNLIRDSGVSLERLVSEILDVSKIEAGRLELEVRPFDLNRVIRSCIEVMRPLATAKGLSVQTDLPSDKTWGFLGDGPRLQQVLTNLLSNAVKFTDRGQVSVSASLSDISVSIAQLNLVVEDTGLGFNAEQAVGLFDRFSQADSTITRRFGGTGLGLSICHSLILMMGGQIRATSTPGIGSRFEIEVPLTRAVIEASNDLDAAIETGSLGSSQDRPLRVLLAEDHPTNQRVVQLILSTQNADLTIVPDGAQAVAAFKAADFDLILMDMQMPVMDGLTATRTIRAMETDEGRMPMPIVMLSANAMAEHRREALEAGADLHVAKPITAASLLTGMKTALDKVANALT